MRIGASRRSSAAALSAAARSAAALSAAALSAAAFSAAAFRAAALSAAALSAAAFSWLGLGLWLGLVLCRRPLRRRLPHCRLLSWNHSATMALLAGQWLAVA